MNGTSKKSTRGITLVELIVVLAIIGLMTALTLPGLARLGSGSRNEVSRTAREIFSLLRAAKIYAATYRVDTAVVYNPENLYPLGGIAASSTIRRVSAIAVLYKPLQPPPSMWGCPGCFVPVPGESGQFALLPQDTTILLEEVFVRDVQDINDLDGDGNTQEVLFQRFDFRPRKLQQPESNIFRALGMKEIPIGGLDSGPSGDAVERMRRLAPDPQDPSGFIKSEFPAHVFKSSGRIDWRSSKERVRIYVAPSPELPESDRQDPLIGLVAIPIDLYRSTGRVKLAT